VIGTQHCVSVRRRSRTFVQKKHGHRVSPASRQGDLWQSALVKERQKEREREGEGGRRMAPARQPTQEREREGSCPAGKRRGLTLAGATNDNTRRT